MGPRVSDGQNRSCAQSALQPSRRARILGQKQSPAGCVYAAQRSLRVVHQGGGECCKILTHLLAQGFFQYSTTGLRALAKEKGIKGHSVLDREQLEVKLSSVEASVKAVATTLEKKASLECERVARVSHVLGPLCLARLCIIVQSCRSGVWAEQLQALGDDYRLVVQTACGSNEVSFDDNLFTECFLDYQR
jgi:hypothetical protein